MNLITLGRRTQSFSAGIGEINSADSLGISRAWRANECSLLTAANNWYSDLIQEGQYIGDVYSISYETALVLIHDFHRREVGGIPSLSFLIATRIQPDANQY